MTAAVQAAAPAEVLRRSRRPTMLLRTRHRRRDVVLEAVEQVAGDVRAALAGGFNAPFPDGVADLRAARGRRRRRTRLLTDARCRSMLLARLVIQHLRRHAALGEAPPKQREQRQDAALERDALGELRAGVAAVHGAVGAAK